MSTITIINSTDLITNSRTDINNNFSNLNTDKIETSYLDTDTTLAANSDSKIATQKAVKAYVDTGGNVNASTTVKGIVEESTAAELLAGTGTGGTGARLFANPSTLQKYLYPTFFNLHNLGVIGINAGFFTDDPLCFAIPTSTTAFKMMDITNNNFAVRTVTTDWTDADSIRGQVVSLGLYVYVLLVDTGTAPDEYRVYRYLKSDLTSVTQMTFSGQALTAANVTIIMTSDGTNFYFNFQAGNSASGHIISKYSISGTTFTYISSVTCGTTASFLGLIHVRASDGHIIGMDSDSKTRRFDTSGVLQATSIAYNSTFQYFSSIAGVAFYMGFDTATDGQDFLRIPIV